MVWSPHASRGSELFAFTSGSTICVEDLKSGKQRLISVHREDITALALRNDCRHMASAAASGGGLVAKCQIVVLDCMGSFECVKNLEHVGVVDVRCLKYSCDDRYLVSIGDLTAAEYSSSLVLWSTVDYSVISFLDDLKVKFENLMSF